MMTGVSVIIVLNFSFHEYELDRHQLLAIDIISLDVLCLFHRGAGILDTGGWLQAAP